jgi:hypothetical protein
MQEQTRPKKPNNENVTKDSPDDMSNANEVPRGRQLQDELKSISSHIKELESALALPEVNEDGSSECPFAQSLYAKKEELEEQVTHDLEKLKRYAKVLDNEIQRCQRNLAKIQADGGKLNLLETSEHYSHAANAQQQHLKSAIEDKDAISVVLSKAQAVLNVSRTRKYPGKKPQEQPFPMPPFGTPGSTCIRTSTGEPGSELTGLISLRPLGKP